MKKIDMKSVIIGSLLTIIVGMFCSFQGTIHPTSLLTPEQKAVLDLLSVETLPDCVGGPGYQTLRVTGANLQIVNGIGNTETTNGLGNIIVGYGEANLTDCHNDGSHNLIVGKYNAYSGYGNLISGIGNESLNVYETALGGTNKVIGFAATILGGDHNINMGIGSVISGGYGNSIDTNGNYSSINGGRFNQTSNIGSVVSGGNSRSAIGADDWVAGSLFEDN